MIKRLTTALALFASLTTALAETAASSEVKIPLERYIAMVDREKTEPLTVIDEVALKGDYRNANFQIAISGKAIAPWKKTPVLQNFEGYVRDCNGSAIVTFESGNYEVVPQKSDFKVTCKLLPKNKNLELSVMNALYFESLVANAESTVVDQGDRNYRVSLFERPKPSENQKHAAVMAKAQYKITILPDNSKFDYQLAFTNPNRGAEKFVLNWANNEIIENVNTNLQYEEREGGLVFVVPSGSHTAYVKGKLNGTTFKPLLQSEEQYLLIQNHPLMQVQATTNWRRIATSESSIGQEYNSARAFLIDPKQTLSWSAKKLQVFTALGYTVKSANYLYYVARDGGVIVEATYNIANQGTPEISMAVPGQALYMSLDGTPSPLYKDEKGNLLVTMSSGAHNLVLQYQPEKEERRLASYQSADLVKPNAVISGTSITVRHDPAWRLFAGRFSDSFLSPLSLGDLVKFLIMTAIFFYILRKMYNVHDQKIVYGGPALVGLIILSNAAYAQFFALAAFALIVWRYRQTLQLWLKKITAIKFTLARTLLFGGALLMILFVASLILSSTYERFGNKMMAYDKNVSQMAGDSRAYRKTEVADSVGAAMQNMAPAAPKARGKGAMTGANVDEGEAFGGQAANAPGGGGGQPPAMESQGEGNYEGIPARIDIPDGKEEYFSASLVDVNKPLEIHSLFVKNYIFMLWTMLLLAALAALLYRQRRTLHSALVAKHHA